MRRLNNFKSGLVSISEITRSDFSFLRIFYPKIGFHFLENTPRVYLLHGIIS